MTAARLFATLLALNLAGARQAAPPTRILLLLSYPPNAAGVLQFSQGLESTVDSAIHLPVEYYPEFLDLDRFGTRERWPQLARYFEEKYRGLRPDVIVAVGSTALQFTTARLAAQFPNVPVVFALAVESTPTTASALPPNVTGRLADVAFGPTMAMARRLQPDAERIVIIGGSSPQDSAIVRQARAAIEPESGNLPISVTPQLTYDELLSYVHRLPRRTIVLFAFFRRDRTGHFVIPANIMSRLTAASSAPVYGFYTSWFGTGLLGGVMIPMNEDGAATGRLVLRVLQRGPNQPLPPPEVSTKVAFADWRQLQRFHLSEFRLPAGSRVLFREPTTWERHRVPILAALGIFTVLLTIITLLLVERGRRQQAQRELGHERAAEQASEALNRAVLSSLGAQIAIVDRTGRIIRVNDAWRDVARRANVPEAIDAFVGWSYLDECRRAEERGVTEAAEVRRGLEEVLDGRMGSFHHEYHWLSPDVRWFELRVDPLERHGDGGAILTHLDISERRLAELRLEELRGQVAHLGRVATVGELAAAVSHELRQPLTAIRTNAETGTILLTRSPDDVSQALEIFRDITSDSERASEVIENIRMLLRRTEMTTRVDLNAICRQAVRLVQREAWLRHTQLELTADPTLPPVLGDPVQLQQVLLNLVLNAVDAASSSADDRKVTLRTALSDGMVELSVSDTGPGLPPTTQQHLFEPFFSSKPDGLGLGLVIVRSIVERHHGRVRATNHGSGGAVFRIELPRADGGVEAGEWKATAEQHRPAEATPNA